MPNTAAYKRTGLGDFTGKITNFDKPKEEQKIDSGMAMTRKRSEQPYTNTTGDMQRQNSNITKDEEEPLKATRVSTMPTYK